MKKNLLLTAIIFSMSVFCFAQQVEKIGEIKGIDLIYKTNEPIFTSRGSYEAYEGISVNEVDQIIRIGGERGKVFKIPIESPDLSDYEDYPSISGFYEIPLNDYSLSVYDFKFILKKNKEIIFDSYKNKIRLNTGIVYISKSGNNDFYILFNDSENNLLAVDTSGIIYQEDKLIEILKKNQIIKDEIIKTISYISDRFSVIQGFPYITQYDLDGNAYSIKLNNGYDNYCEIYLKNENRIVTVNDNSIDEIINKELILASYSYVGFGGNIYFYLITDKTVEVYRIRRTWGDPDFYAMAINGYTDDSYGKYVNEVLPTLSKADLRLLRNTIFAIYGVHFKSADLSKYFDKQVWYTDEGKTSGEVTLPAHRQKLVEMIQALEKK